MPGKFESLYCEVLPGHEYSTDGDKFKGSFKSVEFWHGISMCENVQSMPRIVLPGAASTGGGARGIGGFSTEFFLVKTPLISSRL